MFLVYCKTAGILPLFTLLVLAHGTYSQTIENEHQVELRCNCVRLTITGTCVRPIQSDSSAIQQSVGIAQPPVNLQSLQDCICFKVQITRSCNVNTQGMNCVLSQLNCNQLGGFFNQNQERDMCSYCKTACNATVRQHQDPPCCGIRKTCERWTTNSGDSCEMCGNRTLTCKFNISNSVHTFSCNIPLPQTSVSTMSPTTPLMTTAPLTSTQTTTPTSGNAASDNPSSTSLTSTHTTTVNNTAIPGAASGDNPSSMPLTSTHKTTSAATVNNAANTGNAASDSHTSTPLPSTQSTTPAATVNNAANTGNAADDQPSKAMIAAIAVSILVLAGTCVVLVFFLIRRKQRWGVRKSAMSEEKTTDPERGPSRADPTEVTYRNPGEVNVAGLSEGSRAAADPTYRAPSSRLSEGSVHMYSEIGGAENAPGAAFQPIDSIYRLARAPDEATAAPKPDGSSPYEFADDPPDEEESQRPHAAAEYKRLEFSGRAEGGPVSPSAPPAESLYHRLNAGTDRFKRQEPNVSLAPPVEDEPASREDRQARGEARGVGGAPDGRNDDGGQREGGVVEGEGSPEGGMYHVLEETSPGEEAAGNVYHVLEEERGPATITTTGREEKGVYQTLREDSDAHEYLTLETGGEENGDEEEETEATTTMTSPRERNGSSVYHILEKCPPESGDEVVLETEATTTMTSPREGNDNGVYHILEKCPPESDDGVVYNVAEEQPGPLPAAARAGAAGNVADDTGQGEEQSEEDDRDASEYNTLNFDGKISAVGKAKEASESVYNHLGENA